MEVALRKKRYGGWWKGLGDESTDDAYAGFGTAEGADPTVVYADPGYNIGTSLDSTLEDIEKQLIASGYGKSDTGTPSSLPSVETIAKAISSFAQIGVKALAPSAVTGGCPAGYVLNGAACVPIAKTGVGAPLIAGVPNSTLMLIGGGFLFLMLLSKGGGRR